MRFSDLNHRYFLTFLTMLVAILLLIPAVSMAQNNPPVADAGEDQTILVDTNIILQGAATDPDGDQIVGWLWSVDSTPAGSSPSIHWPDEPDPQFFSDLVGNYILSLIAFDGAGWSEPDFVSIELRDLLPPVAVADVDITSGPAPLAVQFDGSLSTADPLAGQLVFTWSFGDGNFGSVVTTTHTYELPGTYLATLTVVDEFSQSDQDTIEITVTDPSNISLSASDAGRYSSSGFHDPDDTDHRAIVGGTRNFFVFDLTGITDMLPVASATLTLDTGIVSGGTFGGITYTLYDVSTPIVTLIAGGDGLTTIYDDLGTGVEYSTANEIAPEDAGTQKSIPLLPAGVAAVSEARGGLLAIGGGPTGLGGNFAFSGTDVSGAQLVIEFGTNAIPTLSEWGMIVFFVLLVGSALWIMRKRKKQEST